jgi:hypothetical protein
MKTIESAGGIAPGSATARAQADETPPAAGFFQTGSTVSLWFPFVKDASSRNAILIEQAMSLGRFGVLTFLYPADGKFPPAFD